MVELLRCCLLLEQAEFKSAQMSDESMSLIQSVVSVTPNSVDENSSSFQIAVATAFRDFFRFCYVSTSSVRRGTCFSLPLKFFLDTAFVKLDQLFVVVCFHLDFECCARFDC